MWQDIKTAPKDGREILWRSFSANGKRTHAVIFWPAYEECFKEGEWHSIPGDDKLALLKRAQKDIDDNPPYGSQWNRRRGRQS